MKWFWDMFLLFLEWLLVMIIPLVIGLFIGWLIWHRKSEGARNDNEKLEEEVAESTEEQKKDDLTLIDGIDIDEANKLNNQGILSYRQLALTPSGEVDDLEDKIECDQSRIREENWIPQAAQLHFETYGEEIYDQVSVEGVYQDVFEKQIAESKKGMVLDYKDDLKLVSGVGPKMEGILRDFGVNTFYQLSFLDKEGADVLNEKIKSFPRRIERDNWIGQAKELYEKHHK
jgi:predicted flap endonuclease-1-like 5' DNA nuclease